LPTRNLLFTESVTISRCLAFFILRQHSTYRTRYWYSISVRPSVCLSVCHALVLC